MRRQPPEGAVVPAVTSVVGELVEAFGWPSMVLVYFNDGVTRRVAEEVFILQGV